MILYICTIQYTIYYTTIVQLLSRVWFFEIPWTTAYQTSLFFTIPWSLLKLMSIELVMPSNHLILYRPLLLLPSIFLSIRVFSYELEHYIYYTNCFDLWSNIIPCGEGNGTPLQYSCLENPMDRGAWKAAVHGVAEGGTRLSDFTFTFHFHALEKEMATHSSVLAWRIPGMEEPGGLPSMGSHRVGHDWRDLAALSSTTT